MEPTRSLRLTWQAKRSSLSDMPTSVSFAYFAPAVVKSFDIAVADPIFAEKVLPHEQHFHDGLVQSAPYRRGLQIYTSGIFWVYLRERILPSP